MLGRNDDEIQRDVVDALLSDVRLDISDLNVQVQRGTVRLQGKVSNLFQHHLAERIAGRIKGVAGIVNELSVGPDAVRDDSDIATDVAAALLRDTWIDGHKIQVRVENGVVLLDGTVDSYVERASAEDDVRTVRGVKKIINSLDIRPGPKRHDQEIASDIRLDLLRQLRLGRSEIDVSVIDSIARVRGSVDSIETRRAIEEIVQRTPGVKGVVNEVKIVA